MATKKTGSGRGGRTKKQRSKAGSPPTQGSAAKVIGIIFIALGLLAGYIMWSGGNVSNPALLNVEQVLKGVAGVISYALPVMVCGIGIVIFFVGRGRIQPMRAFLTILCALVFMGVWHVFSADSIEQTMMVNTYREFIRASYREGISTCRGAGALGALTSWYPFIWLDKWGAAIVLIGVLAAIAVSLSRTSMRDIGAHISEQLSDSMDEYRQRRQVRGREKAELRAQSLERQVAREERERERREEHDRIMEEERARRDDARSRADELERRRKDIMRNSKRTQDDDDDDYLKRERSESAPEKPAERPAAQEETKLPEEERTPVRPFTEDDVESAKSRNRGDQQAYYDEMKRRMAQEGVPMFLDKRVPGRVLTKSGVAPAQTQTQTEEKQPSLVFSGYDEPAAQQNPDDASYAPKGYAVSPRPDVTGNVLDLGDSNVLPDMPEIKSTAAPRAVLSADEASMRPLRSVRATDGDERVQHSTTPVRRIAESLKRDQNAHPQSTAPRRENVQETRTRDESYDDDYIKPTQSQTAPVAPASAANAAPRTAAPAAGSAYAAGTEYENGMPFERYSEPASIKTDAPAAQYDDLVDYEEAPAKSAPAQTVAAAPQFARADASTAAPQPAPQSAPSYDAYDAADNELTDYDEPLTDSADETIVAESDEVLPAYQSEQNAATDAQSSDISFDGYSGEGGVNEEIAVQQTPEVVPEAAARVAMYTPVNADLERGVGSGTRPDGTPIRMPKAMEEIPQDKPYFYPPVDLLKFSETGGVSLTEQRQSDTEKALKLEQTLQSFGIQAKVVGISRGPAITRFEMTPAPGVRVSKISGLADDIALNLAATTVRIEAPIPGKSAVGIELPNDHREMVTLRDVLDSPEARKAQSKLAVALGKDNAGKLVIADIAKMPHVLIAGATGSGKSVCINTIIMSIIYRSTPDEVRLILIDPKVVELSVYNGVPHLLVPVVTDPKKAASALNWAVLEMTERYQKFAERGVRDIRGYNNNLKDGEKPLPQIVVIIDELADLMMVAPGEVEDAICRLAQLARAAGIHLVIATQRPSVNVITGVIKANIPSRIAFTVASQVDSRTILDSAGAEKLLGRGDMLFFPQGVSKPQRVQGANVTDEEVNAVTEFIKSQHEAVYNPDILEQMENAEQSDAEKEEKKDDECDPLLSQAVEIAVELGQVSISMLQRRMRIGYARAGRIVDEMTQRGIIGAADGAKPRMLLISREEFKRLYGDKTGD